MGETGLLWAEPVTGRPGVSGPGGLWGTSVSPVLQARGCGFGGGGGGGGGGFWGGGGAHLLTAQELAGVRVSGVRALKGLPEPRRAKAPTFASASSPASSPWEAVTQRVTGDGGLAAQKREA